MAAAMIVSVSPEAFSNNGCTGWVKQELTEETEVCFSSPFSLFAPVEFFR
jgi:hypothetical protein